MNGIKRFKKVQKLEAGSIRFNPVQSGSSMVEKVQEVPRKFMNVHNYKRHDEAMHSFSSD